MADAIELRESDLDYVLGTSSGVREWLRWQAGNRALEYEPVEPHAAARWVARRGPEIARRLRELLVPLFRATIHEDEDVVRLAVELTEGPLARLVLQRRRRTYVPQIAVPQVLEEPRSEERARARTTPLEIRLESAEGHRVPEAAFEITFEDGTRRSGTLRRDGTAVIPDAPPGRFEIRYPQLRDIRAKGLAARLHAALQSSPPQWNAIYSVLSCSGDFLDAVSNAYRAYFDTKSGRGLAHDLEAAAEGTDHELPIDHLASRLGSSALPPKEPARVLKSKLAQIDVARRGSAA